ncbi:MAG: alpha-hydroxy-acid oxidizing protein [Tardiphaga sp.]|nr:alpha-hydroxy-acid oxidizing protein [Tardiphaga sp.]
MLASVIFAVLPSKRISSTVPVSALLISWRRFRLRNELGNAKMLYSSSDRTERALADAQSIFDLRILARRRLPLAVFDFIEGGAADEKTLRGNSDAFDDWYLMPRVAVDVSQRSLRRSILGLDSQIPVMLSPTGLAGFFRRDGEVAAARAASSCGVPFCLSTNSIASIEDVARASPDGDRWFQLYFLKDRDWMNGLLDRAAAADYRALCLTVDLPLTGRRERDAKNAFTLPLRPTLRSAFDIAKRPAWLFDTMRSPIRFGNFDQSAAKGFTSVAQHVATLFDPSANWDDVARIRDRWKGPLAIKGILHPDDAAKAIDLGAEAVIVSNHGGRQLDHSPPALVVLPDIVDVIGGRGEIILDGGVRRGTDILKAIALGATAGASGRTFLWGLAAGGEAGVRRAIEILRLEMDNAMALIGVSALNALTRDHVRRKSASENARL